MSIVRGFIIIILLSVGSSTTLAQGTTVGDKVFGGSNLGVLAKLADNRTFKDMSIKNAIRGDDVYVVVIEKRGASDYVLRFAKGRETSFREMKLQKDDYDWLFQEAKDLERL